LERVLDGPIEKLPRYDLLICGSVRCGWKGDKPFRDVLVEKLRAAGIGEDQAALQTTNCFGVCTAEAAGHFSHVLVRPDKVLYRIADEADLDEIVREHLLAGRVVERLTLPGKTVGRKFSNSTATSPSSTVKPASPCGTTACSTRRASKNTSTIAASRRWPRCWSGAIRSGSSRRYSLRNLRGRGGGGFHRAEMDNGRRRSGKDPLPHLQADERRSRRLHGPQHVGSPIR